MLRRLLLFLAAALLLRPADTPPMRPYLMDHRAATSASLDLSFLLDAPAGKRGFVRVNNGHLVSGDGKRLRLWGVNVTDWSRGSSMLLAKEDASAYAATLARYGVNCVRLHFLDLAAPRGLIDPNREDTREFDVGQLDRLDFWISELKKKGIYIDLNLNVGRSYKAGDGVADADKIRWGKGITFYDARLIELQKEYARKLLTHRNPYTMTEYRNEPAIAVVELVNENALYVGFRAPTPAYDQELLEQYNEWLRANLTPEALENLRNMTGVKSGEPVPRLAGRDTASAPKERFQTEMRFFMEKESRFFAGMSAHLRELGVKVPVIATADHSHSGSSYPLLTSTSKLDIVDGHTYWQHPGSPKMNTPMVSEPLQSTVVELSRSAVAGKPYTVSEVNHPFPNRYAAEGIPILAAYAGMQDWDGLFWYTFEPKPAKDWKGYMGDPFDISHDPVKMPQLAAGALLFLRGDVSPAKQVVERSYTREQVYESTRLARTERPYFTPGFPLSLPLQHRVRIRSFDGPATSSFEPTAKAPIVSDTGELTWNADGEQGSVIVDTERSQAEIGFTKAYGKGPRNLDARIDNTFGAVLLTSLDSRPVAKSARMLLATGGPVANTAMEWNDTGKGLKKQGESPSLIEPITGRILLRNIDNAKAITVRALDGSGTASGDPITASKTAEGWSFDLGVQTSTWYEVSVKR